MKKWHDHISRRHVSFWPKAILGSRDSTWLIWRRIAAGSKNIFHGRTNTRVTKVVHIRWVDSLESFLANGNGQEVE
eukprot:10811259-Karenia_brevis.AAC.1